MKELTQEEEHSNQQIRIIEQQEKNHLEEERRRQEEKQIEDEKERRRQKEKQKEEEERKQIRESLVEELKGMLTSYLIERNTHYLAKDILSPDDKGNREQFIKALNDEKEGLFKMYVETGSSDAVLKKITSEINTFPGIKMKATLNRIVVQLMDAEADATSRNDLTEEAERILSVFKDKEGQERVFALKIQELREKTVGIKTYGNTLADPEQGIISALAVDLEKDVNQLICQNQKAIPNEQAYEQFELKFKARLHSQDDIMSKYTSWSDIVVNLLFSLMKLGNLIDPKAKVERGSFFFDKTENHKEVEAPIDAALEDMRSVYNSEISL